MILSFLNLTNWESVSIIFTFISNISFYILHLYFDSVKILYSVDDIFYINRRRFRLPVLLFGFRWAEAYIYWIFVKRVLGLRSNYWGVSGFFCFFYICYNRFYIDDICLHKWRPFVILIANFIISLIIEWATDLKAL